MRSPPSNRKPDVRHREFDSTWQQPEGKNCDFTEPDRKRGYQRTQERHRQGAAILQRLLKNQLLPDRQSLRWKNTLACIAENRVKVVPVTATADGYQRARALGAAGGQIAYMGANAALPQVADEYNLDNLKDSQNIMTQPPGLRGFTSINSEVAGREGSLFIPGFVGAEKAVYIVEPTTSDPHVLADTIEHEVSHVVEHVERGAPESLQTIWQCYVSEFGAFYESFEFKRYAGALGSAKAGFKTRQGVVLDGFMSERQQQIGARLLDAADPAYGYFVRAWDDPAFRTWVRALVKPQHINPTNSPRVDAFYVTLTEARPSFDAAQATFAALTPEDRGSLTGGASLWRHAIRNAFRESSEQSYFFDALDFAPAEGFSVLTPLQETARNLPARASRAQRGPIFDSSTTLPQVFDEFLPAFAGERGTDVNLLAIVAWLEQRLAEPNASRKITRSQVMGKLFGDEITVERCLANCHTLLGYSNFAQKFSLAWQRKLCDGYRQLGLEVPDFAVLSRAAAIDRIFQFRSWSQVETTTDRASIPPMVLEAFQILATFYFLSEKELGLN